MRTSGGVGIALCLVLTGALAAAAAGGSQQMTGTWVMAVELDDGQGGEATFVLEQEGDEISGTYSGALGSDIEVTGEVTEEGIELWFDSLAGLITYKGKVEGTKIEGTCEYGQLGPGTFKGEKKE